MSVLITGITGFIGSHLSQRLVKQGYDVYGMVRHVSRSELKSLDPILDKIRFLEGDLTEYHSVRSAVAGCNPSAILHLGALTPVRYSFEDPFPYSKINFAGTMNLVHAILEASPKSKLVLASTAEVYGWQPHEPIAEDTKLNPSSPYAVSKVAADCYVQMAVKTYGLTACVLRCNNTYGRVGERGFLVEYVVNSMLHGEPVYIGAPNHIRDYMYVDDHVDAYVRALERDEANGQVFNVSPGNPISNIDLARKVAEMMKLQARIVEGSYPPGYPVRPSGDTDYIVLDSGRIRNTLGWKESVSLEEGLSRTIESVRKPP